MPDRRCWLGLGNEAWEGRFEFESLLVMSGFAVASLAVSSAAVRRRG